MLAELVVLGFILSLDNFRISLALGPLRLRWSRAVQVALMFGFWDGVAPLAGVLAGHFLGKAIEPIADYIGPAVLGAYGLYLLIQASRTPQAEEMEHSWMIFGLPLPLSLDNLIAGTSLGLLGFSPWFSAVVFGAITAVMSLVGLRIGRLAARLIRIRADVLSGSVLVIMAIVLALGFD